MLKSVGLLTLILTIQLHWYPEASLPRWIHGGSHSDGWSSHQQGRTTSMANTDTMNMTTPTQNGNWVITNTKIRLQRNMNTQQRYQLHHEYLTEYQRRNIVPKGLLLKKPFCFPGDDLINSEWSSELWNTACRLRGNAASAVEMKTNELTSRTNELNKELQEVSSPAIYHRTLNQINHECTLTKNNLVKMKERKLLRDEVNCNQMREYTNKTTCSVPNVENAPTPHTHTQPEVTDVETPKHNRRFRKRQYERRRRARQPKDKSRKRKKPNYKASPEEENTNHQKVPIVNLYNYELSEAETSLLSKGLKFCPNPTQIDTLQMKKDSDDLKRRMSLMLYYSDESHAKKSTQANDNNETNESATDHNQPAHETKKYVIKSKNMWIPDVKSSHLDVFLSNVQTDIEKKAEEYNSSKHHDNLSREERQALRNLRSRQDIIIKPADKGSSVVIMSRDDYISEGVRQLSNQSTYQKLNEDPTQKHLEKVRESVEDLEEENDVKKHMVPKTANCPNLYFLPKIHKPNNPGRPIVSGCSCPTAQISKYLDHHLRPFVAKLPSYTQDTTHFLNHIEHFNSDLGPLSTRTILVTADVTSLYTNIPHGEGIQACREALETRVTQRPPTDQLIRLLELILKVNNFQFNGENYLQIEGTAMGTPVAPTYANMFMGNLEKRILSHANSIIFQRSWKRYIDDIFFLWSGSPRSLLKLQDTMNAMHPTIKFTFDSSNETTHFLDVTLTLNNGKITTDLYTKPTDTHAYLLPSSSHPKHTFRSIAYSQALRVRRICSDPLPRHPTSPRTPTPPNRSQL